MEKLEEGISDFGDFKASLFRTLDGRHFIRFEPLNGKGKPHIEWLRGNESFGMAKMFEEIIP